MNVESWTLRVERWEFRVERWVAIRSGFSLTGTDVRCVRPYFLLFVRFELFVFQEIYRVISRWLICFISKILLINKIYSNWLSHECFICEFKICVKGISISLRIFAPLRESKIISHQPFIYIFTPNGKRSERPSNSKPRASERMWATPWVPIPEDVAP